MVTARILIIIASLIVFLLTCLPAPQTKDLSLVLLGTEDVFIPGQDGHPEVRIPSLLPTRRGTLLAFAEGRARHSDQAANKIILKRSTDFGRSWSALQVIADQGQHSLNNPCAVQTRSGKILLMYQSYPPGMGEGSRGLRPGYDGDSVVRSFIITSQNDGEGWSAPSELTSSVKRPERATTIAGGPGIGIQLGIGAHRGRILMPFNEGPYGKWNVYAALSDDDGVTWRMGKTVPGALSADSSGRMVSRVNEVQMVELRDGSVRLNARDCSGRGLRQTSVSTDGGETWSPVADVRELRDPSCMASVLRYSFPEKGQKSVILYSGPFGSRREQGTMFLSDDEGSSWQKLGLICPLDFGYSCLGALGDGTVGCLFEGDEGKITFSRFRMVER